MRLRAITIATAISTCSSAVTSRSISTNLPQFGRDKTCEYRGIAVQCGPRGLPGESDFLFRNDGNGRFTEVSQKAGRRRIRAGYFGLGVAWFDYNEDGWLDLYVANDSTPNFLYQNQKNGTFKEVGVSAGRRGQRGRRRAGQHGRRRRRLRQLRTVQPLRDELLRGVQRALPQQGRSLHRRSFRSKTAAISLPFVGWGNAFFDYDNDGLLDIIVVNGHVYPQLDKARLRASAGYRQRKLLFHNRGNGTFDEVGPRYGPVIMEERVSRGLAVGDLDDDGRLDVVINDLDGSPQLLRNESTGAGNWLLVQAERPGDEHGAIGAVVTARDGQRGASGGVWCRAGAATFRRKTCACTSGWDRPHTVDSLEVRWPDGTTTTLANVKANQVLSVEQPASTRQ